jgi:hypothetical protein
LNRPGTRFGKGTPKLNLTQAGEARTFNREMAKVEAVEAVVDGHTWLLIQSLEKRRRP